MTQTIPDVVLARIDLHRADASHRAAKLDADLRTRVLGASLSARLRKARDQARAEAEAWAILLTYRPDTAKVCPACGRTMEDCTCKGGRACPGIIDESGHAPGVDGKCALCDGLVQL